MDPFRRPSIAVAPVAPSPAAAPEVGPPPHTFGALLRRHRLAAGLSQAALAERAGLSLRGVSDLERGARRVPQRATVRLLAGALGLRPEATAALEAAVARRRGPPGRAGARAARTVPHNLPLPLTSFVGRERELAAVHEALAAHRLVTLTGPGGVGKTRLALQAAAAGLEAFPDGAWLVDLAPLADAALVPLTVLAALGVRERPGRPHLATLTEHLRARRLLLVLDNCEHLLDACARLADALLRACLGPRVLATSRELLGVPGEAARRVPSLATPDPRHPPPPARLGRYEAVRLFVDRARLGRPGFVLTDQNAGPVAQVCARLDGLPLAIELAAARLRALPVEQLAGRLDDRFRLLTGGGRTAVPRQQTLQAAIDWSHALLAAPERAVLRRLAVFAGGWPLAAAEAVCAGAGVEPGGVLDLLAGLVDKSLVVFEEAALEPGAGGAGRYRLLETIRQYAEARLVGAGEAARVRRRHRDWYLALAERAALELVGRDQVAWLDRLGAEHDNLRGALAWSQADPDGAAAELRLAAALGRFWNLRGHISEGRAWLAHALERDAGAAPAAARASALNWAGLLASLAAALPAAAALLEASIALGRGLPGRPGLPAALRHLGLVARDGGNDGRALASASR